MNMIDRQLVRGNQGGNVEAQRSDVFCQVLFGLLECHEHSRLVIPDNTADEELHGQ